MGELGSPFRARRVGFLLLFLLLSTRVVVIFVPLSVRLPLLLAFASACLLLFDLLLRPGDLENNKQSESQSTEF